MKFGVPGGCKEDAPAFLNKMNAWRDFVVKSYNQEKLSMPRLYSLPNYISQFEAHKSRWRVLVAVHQVFV